MMIPPTVYVVWDSLTLRAQDGVYFERCLAETLDWSSIYLGANVLERTAPRDTVDDMTQTVEALAHRYQGELIRLTEIVATP